MNTTTDRPQGVKRMKATRQHPCNTRVHVNRKNVALVFQYSHLLWGLACFWIPELHRSLSVTNVSAFKLASVHFCFQQSKDTLLRHFPAYYSWHLYWLFLFLPTLSTIAEGSFLYSCPRELPISTVSAVTSERDFQLRTIASPLTGLHCLT